MKHGDENNERISGVSGDGGRSGGGGYEILSHLYYELTADRGFTRVVMKNADDNQDKK